MPSYNTDITINNSLRSIKLNSFQNFDCHVFSDRTSEILARLRGGSIRSFEGQAKCTNRTRLLRMCCNDFASANMLVDCCRNVVSLKKKHGERCSRAATLTVCLQVELDKYKCDEMIDEIYPRLLNTELLHNLIGFLEYIENH